MDSCITGNSGAKRQTEPFAASSAFGVTGTINTASIGIELNSCPADNMRIIVDIFLLWYRGDTGQWPTSLLSSWSPSDVQSPPVSRKEPFCNFEWLWSVLWVLFMESPKITSHYLGRSCEMARAHESPHQVLQKTHRCTGRTHPGVEYTCATTQRRIKLRGS